LRHILPFFCLLLFPLLISGCSESTAPPQQLGIEFVTFWGNDSLLGGQMENPASLAIDPTTGNVSVFDGGLIHVFSDQGTYLKRWRANQPLTNRSAGVAFDAVGTLYVTDPENNRVNRFRADGTLLETWGEEGSEPGQLFYPQGIAVGNDGSVYVADTRNHRVEVFDAYGTFLRAWGDSGNASGQFSYPWSIALDGSSLVYVTDRSRVQKFDTEGHWILQWGQEGSALGSFGAIPFGVTVDPSGEVITLEPWFRLQRFSPQGEVLASWLGKGERASGFNFGLAVSDDRLIYTNGLGDFGIRVYDPGGTLVRTFGTARGTAPGQIMNPQAIAVGEDGTVYVADRQGSGYAGNFAGSVRRFTPWGDFIGQWSIKDYSPLDLAVAPDQTVFTLSQYGTLNIRHFTSTGTPLGAWATGGRSIDVDEAGRVWIASASSDPILIYSADGKRLGSWGKAGFNPGEIWGPVSIAVDHGSVVVCDAKSISLFTTEGALIRVIASWPESDRPKFRRVALDGRGLIYASPDGLFDPVSIFNLAGVPRGDIDYRGLVRCFDVAADAKGDIYVIGDVYLGNSFSYGKVLKFQLN
jgi:sugar lactone lactonase YvrE